VVWGATRTVGRRRLGAIAAKDTTTRLREDVRRGWVQLWNHLNESLGCVFLADRGYRSIQFIDCGDGTTPDLLGQTETEGAVVEVKTVNNLECDIDLLKNSAPVARHVVVGVDERLSKTSDDN
jgi:hypothetical protein